MASNMFIDLPLHKTLCCRLNCFIGWKTRGT
jgi:hypothetical protein